jgi:hypothetical protein
VRADGRIYQHRKLARDVYLGRVRGSTSLAGGGAAFLLLLAPAAEAAADLRNSD